jgi:hypothetical protein
VKEEFVMESPRTSHEKNLWEDFRETVRGGVRDLRNMGDELARQGRLRMDVFQCERRLKSALEALGEAVYHRLDQNLAVTPADATLAELVTRIRYYSAEIERLKEEQRRSVETNA